MFWISGKKKKAETCWKNKGETCCSIMYNIQYNIMNIALTDCPYFSTVELPLAKCVCFICFCTYHCVGRQGSVIF